MTYNYFNRQSRASMWNPSETEKSTWNELTLGFQIQTDKKLRFIFYFLSPKLDIWLWLLVGGFHCRRSLLTLLILFLLSKFTVSKFIKLESDLLSREQWAAIKITSSFASFLWRDSRFLESCLSKKLSEVNNSTKNDWEKTRKVNRHEKALQTFSGLINLS